jgi:hypothetical protein
MPEQTKPQKLPSHLELLSEEKKQQFGLIGLYGTKREEKAFYTVKAVYGA